MIAFLSAAGESPVFQKVWNLVDFLILNFELSPNMSILVNVVGAILCMLVPYFLGSISFSVIYSKKVFGVDVRKYGEGDADPLNMFAVFGVRAGVITLLCDLAKVAAAVWFGRLLWEVNGAALAGFFVIFGHMFPAFFRFQGGKGLVCLGMVALTLCPIGFLILVFVFVACLVASRIVAFAAALTAFLYPLILQAFANAGLNVAMAILTTGFVIYMYRTNLKRMSIGEEPKVDVFAFLRRKKDGK